MESSIKYDKTKSDIVKGVAIILMLVHHLFSFPDRLIGVGYISVFRVGQTNVEFIIGIFSRICVAMFLFLSGYGMYKSCISSNDFSYNNIIRRICKFLKNFWVVFIIFIPVGIVFFQSDARYHWNTTSFLLNISTLNTSYNEEWWFVRLYLQLMLFFPLTNRVFRKKNIKYAIEFSIIVMVLPYILKFVFFKSSLHYDLDNIYLYREFKNICLWQSSFLIGYIAAKDNLFENFKLKLIKLNLDNNKFYLSILVSVFFLRTITASVLHYIPYVHTNVNVAQIDFIFATATVFCIYNLRIGNFISKSLIILGKNSTNMWLTHTFFCYYYFQKIIFYPKFSIIIAIFLIIVSLLTSIVINKILKLILYVERRYIAKNN